MGAISQDLSSAGMAAAIEANWIGAFELLSRSPHTELHDEPDMRWYLTPGVPVHHAYFTKLAQEDIEARIGAVMGSFAEHQVPFMWTVGPFTRPPDLWAPASSPAACRARTSCPAWRSTSMP